MRTDPCRDLHTMWYHSIRFYDEPEKNREWSEKLQRLIIIVKNLAIEEIEIHHYGDDYLNDCPAQYRKYFLTKDVYGRAGCVACFYHAGFGLRHVRCKWTAAQELSEDM